MSEYGVSKRELARVTGVSVRTIQRITAGDREGYLDTWMKVGDALGCGVGPLVDGDGE